MIPRSWQITAGCSPASVGCANCYVADMVDAGLTRETANGRVWNGKIAFRPEAVGEPLDYAAPQFFMVNPHGDLFHEKVRTEWIDAAFSVMEICQQHAFQILTKRSARMRDYVTARYEGRPAPANIAFGVSAERQKEANERLPHLFETPCFVRYVTFFPLLGAIDIRNAVSEARLWSLGQINLGEDPLRPMQPEWADRIERDCASLGIPFRAAVMAEEIEARGF